MQSYWSFHVIDEVMRSLIMKNEEVSRTMQSSSKATDAWEVDTDKKWNARHTLSDDKLKNIDNENDRTAQRNETTSKPRQNFKKLNENPSKNID